MTQNLKQITTEDTEGTENPHVLEYIDLAEIQLNGALDMFEKQNYVCATSLANAARNLLWGLINDQNKKFSSGFISALDRLKTQQEDHKLSEKAFSDAVLVPGNGLKHYKQELCEQHLNIKEAATTEICLAGSDLMTLTGKFYPRLERFSDQISSLHQASSAMKNNPTEDINHLSGQIIDCAIEVHKLLGPGLLESAYQQALAFMFANRNIPFVKEKAIPIQLDGLNIDTGYRADLIVGDQIIVEIKSVDKLAPIHDAQLLTYMKLGKFPLGLLLNFNEKLLKDGIKRMRL